LEGVIEAASLVDSGKISSKMLKALLDSAFEKWENIKTVYDREKPQQISDSSVIEKLIEEVIAANPRQVEQFKGGKRTVAAFFVGQVMKASKGQANPAVLNELVVKKLDEA
jgi:aspartyl-tRNA(Asn)/glutamyl-tRNA(Gln) amidotransferase subunit B